MPVTHESASPVTVDGDLAESLYALLRTLPAQRCHHLQQSLDLGSRLLDTLRHGTLPPTASEDPRFSDPGWQQPLQRRALGTWLACHIQSASWLAGLQLPDADRTRLHWLGVQLGAALAPSNSPLNPTFLHEFRRSNGRSLLRGLERLTADLALGRPLAPLAEDDAYVVGRDLANTPGQVILRHALFELIHYQPRQAQVHQRPLLVIPPPLNRYYLLDLTPRQSLIRHALDQGLQVFLISWRNPQAEHAEWGFSHYVRACDQALAVASEVSASPQVNLLGVCAGGLLTLLLQGLLQARCESARLSAVSYLVTPINPRVRTPVLQLAGPATCQHLMRRVWRQGYLSAQQMGSAFAWLRPAQFVWPQALGRYALNEQAPARQVLFWSQDSTRLPARLLEDLIDLFQRDPLARPGHLTVLGQPIDLQACTLPSWHLGAQRDHIVPWENSLPSGRLGGQAVFVQSHSGHIQSLVNPPDHPGARFRSGTAQADADRWLEASQEEEGCWWPHWSAWLKNHAGPLQPAPKALGTPRYPPLQAAPGHYVHES